MSQELTQEEWSAWLGDMPMPEGATMDMMWAARAALAQMKGVDDAVEGLAQFQEIKAKWMPRYEETKRDRYKNKEGEAAYRTLCSIMKSIDEIIEFYRENING